MKAVIDWLYPVVIFEFSLWYTLSFLKATFPGESWITYYLGGTSACNSKLDWRHMWYDGKLLPSTAALWTIDDVTYQLQCIRSCVRHRDGNGWDHDEVCCVKWRRSRSLMVLRPRPSCYTELMSRTPWLDRWTIDYRRGSESISVCIFKDGLSSRVVLASC